MGFDYEYACPKCGTPYIGEIDDWSSELNIECEECGCNFHISAEIIIDVTEEEN